MEKGYTITKAGRQLIAASLATGTPIVWTGVLMGEGVRTEDSPELADMEQLIQPVAAGTSTTPEYKKDRVSMIVEYRSDLNGGIGRGFYVSEFGVYAKLQGEEEEEVLFVYATQGDYPVWVGAFDDGARDIRRWPLSIVIGAGLSVDIGYSPQAFMTAEDINDYTEFILLPILLERADMRIKAHNVDPDAHAGTSLELQRLKAQVGRLELQMGSGITKNPWTVSFENLDDVEIDGVWNRARGAVCFGAAS